MGRLVRRCLRTPRHVAGGLWTWVRPGARGLWGFLRRWLRPRRLFVLTGATLLLAGAAIVGSVAWVHRAAGGYLYQLEGAPARPVALVLGSQVYSDGTPSPVLVDRLDAAHRLYQRGKVRAILVSGDNGQVEYNEVDPMRAWLIARGIPEKKVVGDYAGFDTYSSCARAVRIFGVDKAVVVTQAYHLPRAVALCRRVGIDAIGVPAGTSGLDPATLRRLSLRDDVACVKASFQMIMRPDPKYLGRHETGIEDALRAG